MKRAPKGTFNRLKPTIHHLYVEQAIPFRLIAERLGLNPNTLQARIVAWGFVAEREDRHWDVLEEVQLEAA